MATRRITIKDTLAQVDVKPSKRKGQNFLRSNAVAERICEFARITKADTVFEVGPGLGALTEILARQAGRLILFEVEQNFVTDLLRREIVAESDIHLVDVREISLATYTEGKRVVVVSNVPYSISTEFLLWLFDNHLQIERAHLLLQKEYAERVTADPGCRAYGSLTVLRSRYASAKLGAVVAGNEFHPPAGVESQLLELNFYDEKKFPEISDQAFSRVVKAAFSKRRKTLSNSLLMSELGLTKETLVKVLDEAQIDGQLRAENLSLEDYARLVVAVQLETLL